MQNVIVLAGKPYAGKGTRQKEFLNTTNRKFKSLSVGDLLKQETLKFLPSIIVIQKVPENCL